MATRVRAGHLVEHCTEGERVVRLILHEVDFSVPAAVSELPWYDGDPEHFDGTSLRYLLFPSRVTFSVGDVVVMGPRRLVPLFDLLSCVAWVLVDVREKRPASMGFTESADRIQFKASTGDSVVIVYAEARSRPGVAYFHETRKARADREDLVDTLTAFLSSGLRLLTDNVAGLERNRHVRELATQP
jgi:hypothetical protein